MSDYTTFLKKNIEIFNYEDYDINNIKKYIYEDFIMNNRQLLEKYPKWVNYILYYDNMINKALRNNLEFTSTMADTTIDIISILNESGPLTKELILFRGIKPNDTFNPIDWTVGQEIIDLGFVSKSASLVAATDFSNLNKHCCVLMIKYPQGSKHIYFEPDVFINDLNTDGIIDYRPPAGGVPYEYELLTYPGEIFKVIQFAKISDIIEHDFLQLYRVQSIYDLNIIILEHIGNVNDDSISNKIRQRTNLSLDKIEHNSIDVLSKIIGEYSPYSILFSSRDIDELEKGVDTEVLLADINLPINYGLLAQLLYMNKNIHAYVFPLNMSRLRAKFINYITISPINYGRKNIFTVTYSINYSGIITKDIKLENTNESIDNFIFNYYHNKIIDITVNGESQTLVPSVQVL